MTINAGPMIDGVILPNPANRTPAEDTGGPGDQAAPPRRTSSRTPRGRGATNHAAKAKAELDRQAAESAREFVKSAVADGKIEQSESNKANGEAGVVDRDGNPVTDSSGTQASLPNGNRVADAAKAERAELKKVFDPEAADAADKLAEKGQAAVAEAEAAAHTDERRAELAETLENLEEAGFGDGQRAQDIRNDLDELDEAPTEARDDFAEAYVASEQIAASHELEADAKRATADTLDAHADDISTQLSTAAQAANEAFEEHGSQRISATTFLNMDAGQLRTYVNDPDAPDLNHAFVEANFDALIEYRELKKEAETMRDRASDLDADADEIRRMLDDNNQLSPWDAAPIEDGRRASETQIAALRAEAPNVDAPTESIEIDFEAIERSVTDRPQAAPETSSDPVGGAGATPDGPPALDNLLPEDRKNLSVAASQTSSAPAGSAASATPDSPSVLDNLLPEDRAAVGNGVVRETPQEAEPAEPEGPSEQDLAAARAAVAAENGPAGTQIDGDTAAVVVQSGHSLWQITQELNEAYGTDLSWPELYELNADQIENPDLIYPGQVFILPPEIYAIIDERAREATGS